MTKKFSDAEKLAIYRKNRYLKKLKAERELKKKLEDKTSKNHQKIKLEISCKLAVKYL